MTFGKFSNTNKQKALAIIGGSGFIGSRLISEIQADYDGLLVNIDKAISEENHNISHIADIRSKNSIQECMPDDSILIHLAAEHRDDVFPRSLYYDVNVSGTRNICEVANSKGSKFIIFLSSVAVYGAHDSCRDEGSPLLPNNDYGVSKLQAENILKNWQEQDSKERTLVIIRPTVVFGEKNRGNIYNLMRQIATGKFVMIGNGENKKSIAYVGNLVAFIKYCLNNSSPGLYLFNYVDKPDMTMSALIDSIYKILGSRKVIRLKIPACIGLFLAKLIDIYANISKRRLTISSIRIQKFCANSIFSTKIFKETKFQPPYTVEKSLKMTVEYDFLNNK